MNLIRSHWRQLALLVVAILSYMFMPTDVIWSFVWAIIGILILKQFISLFDRYWSRKGREVSLSTMMGESSPHEKAIIYAAVIIGASFIIGSAISL